MGGAPGPRLVSRGRFFSCYVPRVFKALICAVAFLTRMPVPEVEASERQFARAAGFFPWVGMLVAAACWVCSLAVAPLGARLAALCCVALWAWITGGLHLDGLADTADGLAGGRGETERTLEVMRDSRIGAHGAVVLALALCLKWAALERLFAGDTGLAWLAAPVVARALATLLIAFFPYARQSGLGSSFADHVGAFEVVLALVAMVPLAVWLPPSWAPAAGVGALAGLLVALRVRGVAGGLTGDTYGACIEVCEGVTLLALAWG